MSQKTSSTPCSMCGAPHILSAYIDCAESRRMKERGLCFTCANWSIKADKGCGTVIDGYTYQVGTRTSGDGRGMAGRRFDIEYFDGRKVTTVDLWAGAAIPPQFRDQLPDTARFANGGERVNVGGTICWNPSAEP